MIFIFLPGTIFEFLCNAVTSVDVASDFTFITLYSLQWEQLEMK